MARFEHFDGSWRTDADRLKRINLFEKIFQKHSGSASTSMYSDLYSHQKIESPDIDICDNNCILHSEEEDCNSVEALKVGEPNCTILDVGSKNDQCEIILAEIKDNIENGYVPISTPKKITSLGKRTHSVRDQESQTPPSTFSTKISGEMNEPNFSAKRLRARSKSETSVMLRSDERSNTLQSVVNIENVYILPQNIASIERNLGNLNSQQPLSEEGNTSNAVSAANTHISIGSQIDTESPSTDSARSSNKNIHLYSQETIIHADPSYWTSSSNANEKNVSIEDNPRIRLPIEKTFPTLTSNIKKLVSTTTKPNSSFDQLLASSQTQENVSSKPMNTGYSRDSYNSSMKNDTTNTGSDDNAGDMVSESMTVNGKRNDISSQFKTNFDQLLELSRPMLNKNEDQLNALKKFWNIYDTTHRVIRARNAKLRPLNLEQLVEFTLRHFKVQGERDYSLGEHIVSAFSSIIELKTCGVLEIVKDHETRHIHDIKLTQNAKDIFNATSLPI